MMAFNVGVEIGQLLALSMILIAMRYWRSTVSFTRHAMTGNFALMITGRQARALHPTPPISPDSH